MQDDAHLGDPHDTQEKADESRKTMHETNAIPKIPDHRLGGWAHRESGEDVQQLEEDVKVHNGLNRHDQGGHESQDRQAPLVCRHGSLLVLGSGHFQCVHPVVVKEKKDSLEGGKDQQAHEKAQHGLFVVCLESVNGGDKRDMSNAGLGYLEILFRGLKMQAGREG